MPGKSDNNIPDQTIDAPSSIWTNYLFLAAVAVFLYMFLFELSATPFFGDADQSIFLYEAQRLFNGDIMYRDFFEFTMPGTQAFYALMFVIFGVKFWIIGATTLILGVASAGLILAISRRILDSPLYFLPAAIFIFFGFRWVGLDGSHRMFSPVFILLAIWVLLKGTSSRNLIIAGCSLGFASFFTQQRGFVVLGAVLVYLLFEKLFKFERWIALVRNSAAVCVSFGVTLFVLCLYFIIAAGPENFFYATLTYPFKYYSYGPPNHFGVYFIDLQKAFAISKMSDVLALLPVILYCIVLPLTCVTFVAFFVRDRKNIDWIGWRKPFLIAVAGISLTFTTTAPNMFRLFQVSGLVLIVMVWLLQTFGPFRTGRRLGYGVITILMLLGTMQAIRVQTNWNVVHLESPVGRLALVASEQADRYQWLAANTKPGDYFFEVYEPFAYFPLGLKNPTKYGQIWPSEYTRPEHVAETVRDLTVVRPRFILWDNSYFTTSRQPGDHTGPLADFVSANYSAVGDVYSIGGKPVQVWELKAR